jgi:hypothetical protein
MAIEFMKSVANKPGRIRQFRNDLCDSLALIFCGIFLTPAVKVAIPLKEENEFGENSDYVALPDSQLQDNHIDFDIESIISEAVESAAKKCGKEVVNCSINIKLRDEESIESLKNRFEEGDTVGHKEMLRLFDETEITMGEIQQYYDQMREEESK